MESSFLSEKTSFRFFFQTQFTWKYFKLLQICAKKITKKLQVVYLNNVQVSNFEENCAGKIYLRKVLPAHCSSKFTYTLFSVNEVGCRLDEVGSFNAGKL